MGWWKAGNLNIAVLNGNLPNVQKWLERGANVNFIALDGSTPLIVASLRGHQGTVELLLNRGANVDLATKKGDTALMWASSKGHQSIIELLLNHGAIIDQVDKNGSTPLMLASMKGGHQAIVELMLSHGAKIDLANNNGDTALMFASINGHLGIVKLLLNRGAKIDQKEYMSGSTELILASVKGHQSIVELLLNQGANMDLVNNKGDTALMWASVNGHQGIVKLLLNRGAKIDQQENSGNTALVLARRQGNKGIVALLENHRQETTTSPLASPTQEVGTEESKPSQFFVKLLDSANLTVHSKIIELVPLIEDVYQMKMFYTAVATYRRMNLILSADASSYINEGLKVSTELCVDGTSIVIFKLILDKAKKDSHISQAQYYYFDNLAEVTRIENAPFIKSMQEAIRTNTTSIEGLEANITAVYDSVKAIKRGLLHQQQVKATMGFCCTVINIVTIGLAGGFASGIGDMMSTIVDFGDLTDLSEITETCGDESMLKYFLTGVQIGAIELSELELEKALKGQHAMVVLSAAAHLIQSPSIQAQEPTVNSTSSSMNDDTFDMGMFVDAILEEHEEEMLPFHTAVKFGEISMLEKELHNGRQEINARDSEGRTSMDLAALTGQIELMDLIESNDGEFAFKSEPRMRAIAKKRAPHKEKYLEKVISDL
jgi:ankyrin repeat protein